VSTAPHTTFQKITHSQFSTDLLHIDGVALVGEGRVAGDDEEPRILESAVVISSTMPSAKYSCSGSPDMFWNGSTAIEGLSGSGSVRCGACAAPARSMR